MVLMHYGAMSQSREKPPAGYDPAGEVTEICRDLAEQWATSRAA